MIVSMPDSLSPQELYTVFIASREALRRFFTRYLGCPEIASDLVQALYLRLERAPSVSDHEQARAWLFRVATNLARDNVKLRRRRDELLKTARIGGTEYATPTPEDMMLGREQIRTLQAAVAELPSLCAEVLFLSRMEGLTHGAIAKRLGVSKSLVEKHVMRALNHCRRRLNIKGE
ncbi:MAG: RNA polymerase sigma factor [Gammaproteobacteria bacterium]